MKRTAAILILFFLSAFTVFAQETGIRFEKTLTWDQILAKAKAEHKFIFLDCYATWCGPCKWMDANVYNQKETGDLFNKEFISLRVQMDRTNHDDSLVKARYGLSSMLAESYSVSSYPTFLFLDEDGKPVHKSTGSRDVKAFLQLAVNALDPGKQYYSILKNFQPGKMDTAEEKPLARSLRYTDQRLAGQLAADYLARIPREKWQTADNGDLMVTFQDDPQVLAVILKDLAGLNVVGNMQFIEALSKQPPVKATALNYIRKLDDRQLGEEKNLGFIEYFHKEPAVQEKANSYINNLPEDSLYTRKTLAFLEVFTQNPQERGFTVFYRHPDRVNTVMADRTYARRVAVDIINKAEYKPLLKAAEDKQTEPDWKAITKELSKKYNDSIANEIIVSGKLDWYTFLVNKQKEPQYWPQLVSAWIDRVKWFRSDTVTSGRGLMALNNICYSIVFLHCNDPQQLHTALQWEAQVVQKLFNNPDDLDTYACLLYKTGDAKKAIMTEKQALGFAKRNKDKRNIDSCAKTIAEMEQGKPIWLDKERQ